MQLDPLIWETESPRTHWPKIVNESLNTCTEHIKQYFRPLLKIFLFYLTRPCLKNLGRWVYFCPVYRLGQGQKLSLGTIFLYQQKSPTNMSISCKFKKCTVELSFDTFFMIYTCIYSSRNRQSLGNNILTCTSPLCPFVLSFKKISYFFFMILIVHI